MYDIHVIHSPHLFTRIQWYMLFFSLIISSIRKFAACGAGFFFLSYIPSPRDFPPPTTWCHSMSSRQFFCNLIWNKGLNECWKWIEWHENGVEKQSSSPLWCPPHPRGDGVKESIPMCFHFAFVNSQTSNYRNFAV